MAYRHIEVAPIAGAIGAEIGGVDLSRGLDDEVFEEINRAFLEYLVIFFRDQHLTPVALRDFAARFGPPNRYPFAKSLPECDEVIPVIKEAHETANFGGGWHSDTCYLERPPKCTCLLAVETPRLGGDTLFANMYLAYEKLSEGMKAMLEGLYAVNSASLLRRDNVNTRFGFASIQGQNEDAAEATMAEHPVVRTHPETGRKSIYVDALHTPRFRDMSEAESRPILDYLFRQAARPEFTCRFQWRPGSLAVWDNRCAQHNALNDYHGHRRVMHRVTVEGDRPA